jgi:hypothetical protein
MIDGLLVHEFAWFAIATGLAAILVMVLLMVLALGARNGKWRRRRMRSDPRAKGREFRRERR